MRVGAVFVNGDQTTTVWPPYALVLKLSSVNVWLSQLLLKTDAKVALDVDRIWASCQSKVQPELEHSESAVARHYQKLKV